MFKPGEIAFFKRARKSTSRKIQDGEFKGYGFGVFLGAVPPFGKEPLGYQLFQMMGSIGYLTFDDVAEFLGDEHGATCVKMFEDKYYGKVVESATPATQEVDNVSTLILPNKSPILDRDGKPL